MNTLRFVLWKLQAFVKVLFAFELFSARVVRSYCSTRHISYTRWKFSLHLCKLQESFDLSYSLTSQRVAAFNKKFSGRKYEKYLVHWILETNNRIKFMLQSALLKIAYHHMCARGVHKMYEDKKERSLSFITKVPWENL